jgi:hypothetical protein
MLSRLCETGQLMFDELREVCPLIVLSLLNDHQVMKERYFDDMATRRTQAHSQRSDTRHG